MTTQTIINAINEEMAAEKIYMVQRGWESTKRILNNECYSVTYFVAKCELLYDMAITLNGATDEQEKELKALRREILHTCENETGHDLRA